MNEKVAFIGAGSMTEALISGILSKDFLKNEQIYVTNRRNHERLQFLQEQYQVNCVQDNEAAIKGVDIIILSMQPFDLAEAVNSIKHRITSKQLIISLAAGISTTDIANIFNIDVPVIRVNPNMPAAIGLSATGIVKGEYATEEHVAFTEGLFKTIGATAVVSEEEMHIVTGLSGSGPAYVYYLAEAMEKAAIKLGMNKDAARILIYQTFLGAGEMLSQSGDSAETLKNKVISPKGTTEAGINTLIKYDFEQIIFECIKSARDRSIELGG